MTRRGWTALLLAVALLLCSCETQAEEEQLPLIYYVVSGSGQVTLSALAGEPWTQAPETPGVEQYVDRMLEGPADAGLYTVFPEQLRLLSWEEDRGLLTLDFSEEYSELTGITLTLANACLTLTLTQLDGVEEVQVTVMGKALPEGGEPLSPEDLLLTGQTPDPVTLGFQIYFPLTDGSGLGTEYRQAELSGTALADQVDAVVRLLSRGPRHTQTMTNPFEGLEQQLECEMVEDVCLLSLTQGWTQVLTESPQALPALVNSLCELEGVRCVAFEGPEGEVPGLTGTFQAAYDGVTGE